MANRLGHSLTVTSFGESHGTVVGVVMDGFPSGIPIDPGIIRKELERRKPAQSDFSSTRAETEQFEIVSGIFEDKSTGAPICIIIPNSEHRPEDYDHLKNIFRPGHADKVYQEKYGHRDHRGGGRSSARVTAAWVAAGALVKDYLAKYHAIQIQSVVSRVGKKSLNDVFKLDWSAAETNAIRCPDQNMAAEMLNLIRQTQSEGDSLGGVISSRVTNCPSGLGEPLFDKLSADLAKAIFSINAVKGLEFGSGFEGSGKKGSENNDTATSGENNEGGISGGLSNGNDITFNTAFKPVSSIAREQDAHTQNGQIVKLEIKGRHDACVLPRAVPIVETMTALVIADHLFMNLKYKK